MLVQLKDVKTTIKVIKNNERPSKNSLTPETNTDMIHATVLNELTAQLSFKKHKYAQSAKIFKPALKVFVTSPIRLAGAGPPVTLARVPGRHRKITGRMAR